MKGIKIFLDIGTFFFLSYKTVQPWLKYDLYYSIYNQCYNTFEHFVICTVIVIHVVKCELWFVQSTQYDNTSTLRNAYKHNDCNNICILFQTLYIR